MYNYVCKWDQEWHSQTHDKEMPVFGTLGMLLDSFNTIYTCLYNGDTSKDKGKINFVTLSNINDISSLSRKFIFCLKFYNYIKRSDPWRNNSHNLHHIRPYHQRIIATAYSKHMKMKRLSNGGQICKQTPWKKGWKHMTCWYHLQQSNRIWKKLVLVVWARYTKTTFKPPVMDWIVSP